MDEAAAAPMVGGDAAGVRSARAPFREVVLVCRKCARKLDGGFGPGGEHTLRKALKRALKAHGRGGSVRVVEVDCLDLCPKRRQVVATAAGLASRSLLAVRPGADVAEVLARLLPGAEGGAERHG